MSESKILKAAGYVRVSTSGQTEGESLSTQKQSINNYCEQQKYQLTEIYADEGISGGTVKERHALLKCLRDARNGKFDILIVHRLSRLGRNARELLNNVEELSQSGIDLLSISEGIDFGNKYGKAMLGMFAIMAELEKDIITEQFLENKIALARKGIPTSGRLPFGRTYNRETNEWERDEHLTKLLKWSAKEYLNGTSFLDIADTLKSRHDLDISHRYLITVLKERCGDKWTVKFEGEEPIEFTIPRILPEETIKAVKARLAHNQVDTRKDVKKYVLSGFIRCYECQLSLSGQEQKNRYGKKYSYYRHPTGRQIDCKEFSSVPGEQIENAVFRTIFENIADVPSFEKAIADSLPDEQYIKDLEAGIEIRKKELKKITKDLDKLVDAFLKGKLQEDTIQKKEQSLVKAKEKASTELDELESELQDLPDLEKVKKEADKIRRELLRDYSGEERLQEMSYDEKKQLLHWIFDGKDKEGTKYGIYVNKEKGVRGKIDYFMYGKITGLRTVKGDDIDYNPDDDDTNGDDDNGNEGGSSTVSKKNSTHKKTEYKTKNFTVNYDHGLP